MTERDTYFDNLKFLLIVLVVTGHIIEKLVDDRIIRAIYQWIYTFHMPAFAFVSGYFSKHLPNQTQHKKLVFKLIIPYILFEVLYSTLDYLVHSTDHLVFSFLSPNWIMWYLFSLLIWRVLLKLFYRVHLLLPLSILSAVFAGYVPGIGPFASLSRTLVFLPFFLAGSKFKSSFLEKFNTKRMRFIAATLLLGVFAGYYFIGSAMSFEWLYGNLPYASFGFSEWYAGFFRFLLMALASIMIVCMLTIIPVGPIHQMAHVGQNTLYVYLSHGIVIRILAAMGIFKMVEGSWGQYFMILSGFLLTLLLSSNLIKRVLKPIIEPQI
ncbi:MAG: acyltransferase family protein [Eubacteriales bacterium]|nr:acyltransferase family protein [Eubacteriales bacterium]